MPWRVKGNRVEVERNGRWVHLTTHESHDKAVRHMKALYANSSHGKRR